MALINGKIICINAGHFDASPGFEFGGMIEGEETKKIRDILVSLLKQGGYEIIVIPDNLDLAQSIKLANLYDNSLAIDIHLNSRGTNSGVSGTEVYTDNSFKSRSIANILSLYVSRALGTHNGGFRDHTTSAVGSLGWVREIKGPAMVVECLYMDEPIDRMLYDDKGIDKIARGLKDGIDYLCGVEPTITLQTSLQQRIIELAAQLVALYRRLLNK